MHAFPDRLRSVLTFCERGLLVGALVGGLVRPMPAQEASPESRFPVVSPTADGQALTRPERIRPPRFSDVRLANGVRLHYAEQGAERGTPVILLHGYSDTWFSWSLVLPLLPDDLRVYALDQRGHGASDRPEDGYGMDAMADDVIQFMDARGIRRAVVVGHSMGSLIAQQVASRAPERVEGLVLVGSGPSGRSIVGAEEFHEAVKSLEEPVDPDFVEGFQRSTVHAPVPEAFMARVIEDSGDMPAWTWKSLADGIFSTRAARGLDRNGIPTLVLWGERDGVFDYAAQEELVERTRGTLKIYEDTGHAAHWERPDAFARDLTEFVTGTRAGIAQGFRR